MISVIFHIAYKLLFNWRCSTLILLRWVIGYDINDLRMLYNIILQSWIIQFWSLKRRLVEKRHLVPSEFRSLLESFYTFDDQMLRLWSQCCDLVWQIFSNGWLLRKITFHIKNQNFFWWWHIIFSCDIILPNL